MFLRIYPYSVRMRENADQNNPEYRHFLGSAYFRVFYLTLVMFWSFFKYIKQNCLPESSPVLVTVFYLFFPKTGLETYLLYSKK